MKRWCTYCQTVTQPAPAHPGQPRSCAMCRRPFESEHTQAPQRPAEPRGTPAHSTVGGAPLRPTPAAQPGPTSLCFHLHDRNNTGTFHPMPHKRNACSARLHVRHSWWSPTAAIVPADIPQDHQARYCFADYPRCPYFLPPGTPALLLREDNESLASSASAMRKRP
jgi:hypothetical protein